ncbi:MAG: glycosyltransferase [Actinomycetota bacterium]|nr:glycosyltransferase [Actinomycetota bacterium]
MDLSIITVNYNSCQYIRQCIESTRHLDAGLSWEILVVDNGSLDESIDYLDGLAARMGRLKIIKVGSNRGFAHASNLGATRARGKFLMFLNPDARFGGRGIYKLIEFCSVKNEKVGAVGPK